MLKDELMSLIESLPERYKKTAIRKINEGADLQYDAAKGIVNEKGEVVVDISVCKDRVSDVVNQEIDEDDFSVESNDEEESKMSEKKKEQMCDNQNYIDEERDDEDEYEEDELEGDNNNEEEHKKEMREEMIDTFKDKNKISKDNKY